jgi:sugar phosphate isomerase/epimerase
VGDFVLCNCNKEEVSTKMGFSCLPVSLYKQFYAGRLSIPQWSVLGQELGLNAIDINALFMDDMSLGNVEAVRKELMLPVLMVSAYSDFTTTDHTQRNQQLETALDNIRKSQAIGAAYIRLTAGPAYPDCKVHRTIDNVYRCFEVCVAEAQRCGIMVLLENHSQPASWAYPDFNFHPTRVLRLWEKLQSLPIGVNFDVANAYALGNWQEILQVMSGRIETVHINDLACVDPLSFCIVGEGVVCIETMLRAIYATGFSGWMSVEEAGNQGLEGMAKAIANFRKLYAAAIQQDET